MKGKLTKMPRAEQWAERISTQVGKSVESIVEVGRLLVKAKADLAHGEWGRLFSDELIPFSHRTANRLMAIAQNPILSNSTHVSNLPPSWGSLYELTKVEPAKLKNALKDGVVTPDMKRSDVVALLPARKKKQRKTERDTEQPAVESISQWKDQNESERVELALEPARQLASEWPDTWSLTLFIHEVRQLLKHLEKLERRRDEVPA